MKTFKSTDEFNIAGRGHVFVVHVPNPNREMSPPGVPHTGECVLINDEPFEIQGVEMFMKLTYPPFAGENVGLLVRPVCVRCGGHNSNCVQ
jgi:translation elongation factor EF-Tu-like GTPase